MKFKTTGLTILFYTLLITNAYSYVGLAAFIPFLWQIIVAIIIILLSVLLLFYSFFKKIFIRLKKKKDKEDQ